jgi:acetyltransferase-like isoleucine patch superfamily enzyme
MTRKLTHFYKSLSLTDFLRKVIFVFSRIINLKLIRKLKARYYFKSGNIGLGRGIRIHGISYDIKVGNQTSFYDHCIFEFGHNSQLSIGSNVILSYGVLLSCQKKVFIGNDVQVGEYTSIRDTTHDYSNTDLPMKYAEDISEEIFIANDVWIGRGCIIFPGSVIEEGVVVASNSVVKGRLARNGIYGGIPARLIKLRGDT